MRTPVRMMTALAFLLVAAVSFSETQAQVLIDDFSSGGYRVTVSSGEDVAVQSGSMIGGHRRTRLVSAASTYGQNVSLDVRDRDQALLLGSDHQVFHRLEITYGVDEMGQAPLDLDLSDVEGLQLLLDGSDQTLNVNFVLFSAGGSARAQAGKNLQRVVGPRSVHFPRSEFSAVGPFDWSDVDLVILIIQSGTAIGGNDFALRGIAAD